MAPQSSSACPCSQRQPVTLSTIISGNIVSSKRGDGHDSAEHYLGCVAPTQCAVVARGRAERHLGSWSPPGAQQAQFEPSITPSGRSRRRAEHHLGAVVPCPVPGGWEPLVPSATSGPWSPLRGSRPVAALARNWVKARAKHLLRALAARPACSGRAAARTLLSITLRPWCPSDDSSQALKRLAALDSAVR